MELLENTRTTKHVIKLGKSKQLLYNSIYSFGLIELEIQIIQIGTHLKKRFIQFLKSPARALILFHKKSNNSLQLCVHY